jgi:hypothetical protein
MEFVYHANSSGSSAGINFDPDRDNPAHVSSLGNGAGDSNLGKFTAQSVTEFDPVPFSSGPHCSPISVFQGCTIDGITNGCEFQAVGGATVQRFDSTGDLMFIKNTGGTVCLNLTDGFPKDVSGTLTGIITGGTGRFAGVTGSPTATVKGQQLLGDGPHAFSWAEQTTDGTLTFP